jgi:hypothetical protein
VLVCVVLGATLSTARADDMETGAAPHAATADGAEQLTLPKGRVLLDAFLEINLSDQAAFKPISISPDVWYGATDELTVGLVHSSQGSTGFIGGVGDSLCLSGTDNGCVNVYNNVGIDARYKLQPGTASLSWVLEGGVYAVTTDPFAIAVKLGAAGRWHSGKLAIEAQPNVFIGITKRTTATAGAGDVTTNGEFLNVPVTGIYTVAPKIAVAAQLGVILPFENTGNFYQIPLSVGAHYTVNESLNVNLAYTLTAVAGGDAIQTGVDGRSLTLGGTYAF